MAVQRITAITDSGERDDKPVKGAKDGKGGSLLGKLGGLRGKLGSKAKK